MRAPTRNPWLAWHWIPGRARDDSYRVRDDSYRVRDDSYRVRDDNYRARDDNFRLKVRVRYRAGYGRLAMDTSAQAVFIASIIRQFNPHS